MTYAKMPWTRTAVWHIVRPRTYWTYCGYRINRKTLTAGPPPGHLCHNCRDRLAQHEAARREHRRMRRR